MLKEVEASIGNLHQQMSSEEELNIKQRVTDYCNSFINYIQQRVAVAKEHDHYYYHILYAFPGPPRPLQYLQNYLYRGNLEYYYATVSQISSTFPNEAIIQELADKVSIVFQQRIHRACDNWWVPIFSANPASSLGESDDERLLAVVGEFDPSKLLCYDSIESKESKELIFVN